jgi:Skp family chaperone for outer membrane proteins
VRPRRAARALLPVLLAAFLQALVPAALPASPAEAPQTAPAGPQAPAAAPPDRAAELAERERAVKAEEERLLSLRKEVNAKIAKYEKLLADVEAREKRRREDDEAKVGHPS